jgi:hypothetical protein
MQVQGLVAFIVGLVGDLVNLLGGAASTFGIHVATASVDPTKMAQLTNGIFGTTDGLIYWMKNDVFYILTAFNEVPIANGLTELLKAIVAGLGIGG